VLLVDDHALVRDTLAERLGQEPDLEVVGGACDAAEAMDLAFERRPDVVVMDVDMPGLACFEAARDIRSRLPKTRVLFLSAFSNDRYIEQALATKASGYITKNEPPQAVIEAIRAVYRGTVYFSPRVQARLTVDEANVTLAKPGDTRASTLTPRELEVLRYLARGMSKKEIAQTMHLSVKTVDTHSGNLMNKLDIHDRVELARFAIREGLAEA
jgi:DNA-binding NarL/FixJ family response regulator